MVIGVEVDRILVLVSASKLAKMVSFGLISFSVGRAATSFGFGRNCQ